MSLRSFLLAAVFLAAFLLPDTTSAQTYSFRFFDDSDGLPGSYVNTLIQDNKGLMWVGLETGLFIHDGFDFYNVPFPDTISSGYPSASFCDKAGKIWVGCNDGALFVSDNGKPLTHLSGIVADKINKIRSDGDGNIWVISQSNGLFMFEKSETGKFKNISVPTGAVVLDALFISNDTLFLATQDNLYLCRSSADSLKILYTFPELEYQWINCIEKLSENCWAAGTDGSGLFIIKREKDNFTTANLTGTANLDNTRVKELLKGDGNNLYIATREAGVVIAEFSADFADIVSEHSYNIASGLLENDVKTIYRDREGNLWIGLFNMGLEAIVANAFSFFQPPTNAEIRFIGAFGSEIVMGNRAEIFNFNVTTGQFGNVSTLSSKLNGASITSWHSSADGMQWIGTDGEGVFLISANKSVRQFFKAANPGQNIINSIDTDTKNMWLATMDGVVVVDRVTGKSVRVFTMSDMLPHNKALQVVVTGEGTAAIATESEKLCFIDLEKGVYTDPNVMSGYMKNIIQSISFSRSDNSVSIGTLGNGLFRVSGDSLYSVTAQEGLLSSYCYSVLSASDGRIWAGHEKGFSIWDPDAGRIRTFSRDFGVNGDCLPNSIFESSDGHIFVGTTGGVIVYDPRLEKTFSEAPQANILSVIIDGVEQPVQDSYILPYRKSHTIDIKYVGINLHDPLNVVYRTKLENFDENLSQPSEDRSITYRLRDGRYRFIVETASRNNQKAVSQAYFDIVIKKPFYRTWWFTLAAILLAAAIVFVIIKLRDRAHRKLSEFLEEELSKRTREVHEQKEELLQKNLDITESIKYAKRIQSSVLPDTARLGSVFNEAFVFFAPRDIVSGDFYWFDWIDKERFILVCADSTGHGVPGAFMSMIGTALLQDIVTRKKITKPSAILRELDRQIFSTLNQNQEVEAANDGMDIVVCEFNIKNRHLTFASAMRPVILIIDGEQQYVRGNRSSIGGDSATEKFYDDQEYYLHEGDIVYLFSDGYPDQFGGRANKKMKISRLRSLIDEIKEFPLDKQHLELKEFFYEWKSDFEQVDDVLIMGIKV